MNAARSLDPKDVPPELAGFVSALSKLKEPSAFMAFGMGGCGEAVNQYIAAIELGACMLEIVTAAGASPIVPGIGPVPETASEQLTAGISSLAIGAAVIALAYVALRGNRA
jgi:hypothetical protein